MGGLFGSGDTVTVTANDPLSGVASIQMLIDGNQINPDDLQSSAGCTLAGCPSSVTGSFGISRNDLPPGQHTVSFVATDQAGNQTPPSSSFQIYSPGSDGYSDKGVDPPDDPNVGSTDDSTSTTCTSTDPDFPGDSSSCIQNPVATYVAPAFTEPSVETPVDSPLMMGDPTAFDSRSVNSPDTPSTSGSPCLQTPLMMQPPPALHPRWGLADDSAPPEVQVSGPGNGSTDSPTFMDGRAQALAVHRVRYLVPYDIVSRASSANNDDLMNCRPYLRLYRIIKYALAHQLEPLISFRHSDNSQGKTIAAAPTVSQYQVGVKAFLQQFPAVKAYTAFNEPNLRGTDPTYQTNTDPSQSGAVRAGKYWRALNGDCNGGMTCLVVAGDFSDHASFNSAYRAQYLQGMGGVPAQVWAYHPYLAILNGQFNPDGSYTKAGNRFHNFLTWGPVQNKAVWITEAGGFGNSRQHDPGNEVADQASDMDTFLNSPTSMFHRSRITRFYYYEWHGGPSFDTGLVGRPGRLNRFAYNASGPQRPVYCVYRHRTNPSLSDGLCQ